mmetsp:Transcript_45745/g.132465  ORF Transcript_45745/g.132465 Transcript_45745/m.132465 type:complete len:235 (+) Transcript_45745:126-830(+)
MLPPSNNFRHLPADIPDSQGRRWKSWSRVDSRCREHGVSPPCHPQKRSKGKSQATMMSPISTAQNSVGPSDRLMLEAKSETCLKALRAFISRSLLASMPGGHRMSLPLFRASRTWENSDSSVFPVLNSSSRVIRPGRSLSSLEPPSVPEASLSVRGCAPPAASGWELPVKAARGTKTSSSAAVSMTAATQQRGALRLGIIGRVCRSWVASRILPRCIAEEGCVQSGLGDHPMLP